MGVLQGACFIVGGAIGAGFITGAELVAFFGPEGALFCALASSVLFCGMCMLFLRLGKKYGGFRGTLEKLFKRAAPAARIFITLCAFIPSAAMLAALDSLLFALRPLPSLLGLLFSAVALRRGTRGISLVNSVLSPALVLFLLVFGGVPASGGHAYAGGALYAGLNVFLMAPVLMDAGREMKSPLASSLLAACCVFLCSAAVLGRVERAGTAGAEMPYLAALGESPLFPVAAVAAIFTSLVASLYPVLSLADGLYGGKKIAAKGLVLLAAFMLSRLGLSSIVARLYPLQGLAGLFLSVFAIFHEKFLQQGDEKVHHRRKKGKDYRRRHQKVELEHLPAVHDEVSEPRARDDVFAHNRANPRHADVDFEHGDEGRERGRNDKFQENLQLARAHRLEEEKFIFVRGDERG